MIDSLTSRLLKHRRKRKNESLFLEFFRRYQQRYLRYQATDRSIEAALEQLLESAQEGLPVQKAKIDQLRSSLRKHPLQYLREIAASLLLAIFVLVFVRQMAFEHQEIPTGSMRPTFLEHDHVLVRKSAYGINNPFSRIPLASEPQLLQRGDIVTFTSEGLPLAGNDMRYFGLFPGKKRFVKRVVAKPLDRVWFYAGKLWLLPQSSPGPQGPEGSGQLLCTDQFISAKREFIPFHQFFGQLRWRAQDELEGLLFGRQIFAAKKGNWNRWTPVSSTQGSAQEAGQEAAQGSAPATLPWGVQNYAMVRLVRASALKRTDASVQPQLYPYYLEIAHHPTLLPTALTHRDGATPFYVHRSLLPLQPLHLERLKQALYTSRFCIKGHRAYKYSHDTGAPQEGIRVAAGIPEGIYEFESGVAYGIDAYAARHRLEKEHPLYQEPLFIDLFNCGLAWQSKLQNHASLALYMPCRYAYFDQGCLKVMNEELMSEQDPLLRAFVESEQQLQQLASFYPPFTDPGAPDAALIRSQGLLLGPQEAMVLGDNHADSADSRDFGLIPVDNIQGTPFCRFWPLSSWQEGLAARSQPLNRFDLIVWGAILAVIGSWQLAARLHASKQLRRWHKLKSTPETIR